MRRNLFHKLKKKTKLFFRNSIGISNNRFNSLYSVWTKNSESIKIQYNIVIAMRESEEAIPLETECYNVRVWLLCRGKFSSHSEKWQLCDFSFRYYISVNHKAHHALKIGGQAKSTNKSFIILPRVFLNLRGFTLLMRGFLRSHKDSKTPSF